MGADEWTINSMTELFGVTRAGYLSEISPAVEQVTGKNHNIQSICKILCRCFQVDFVCLLCIMSIPLN